ncbi:MULTISPECIES: hypothetical protein [Micromonospora]|uniref:Uncharacterized protein n=1 Tax=Micromonospora yangpuensis TaxID=683228 RepID=A0A1C6U1S6_9ACTN|nr:hypothetical protein [Micromonospora yangpuensis]GGM10837.1 hypothetical protein GCM10012279_31090 [Micromonospora yangpuensis]SCL47964.1 hypothetical protein GA0070617_0734 [Micromonospora yangpuensis]
MAIDTQLVVLLQHSSDGDRWTTVAHGVALDDRHLLLRASAADLLTAAGQLRLRSAGGPGDDPAGGPGDGAPAPLAADEVSLLARAAAGRPDLVMVTPTHGYAPAASAAHGTTTEEVRQVIALLDRDDHPLWPPTAPDGPAVADGPAAGGAVADAPAAAGGAMADGPAAAGGAVADAPAAAGGERRPGRADGDGPQLAAPARVPGGDEPPETPLSWTCRLFGIGCPDSDQ